MDEDENSRPSTTKISIVMPLFNDWESLRLLLADLGRQDFCRRYSVSVLVVDDGSDVSLPASAFKDSAGGLAEIKIVRLVTNLGHQRAIAVGLVCATEIPGLEAVIVMDSDGEDRPSDVGSLLENWQRSPTKIIVARRARRSESLSFRAFYSIYKLVFRSLTGQTINFGNFCLLPKAALLSLVHNPAAWNNLAAAVKRSRLGYVDLPLDRGSRLSGTSRMNFVSLALHGISAISVYTDVVFFRMVTAAIVSGLFVLASIIVVLSVRFATDLAIPGWASYMVGALTIILGQVLLMASMALLQLVSMRSVNPFVPFNDAGKFVDQVSLTHEHE